MEHIREQLDASDDLSFGNAVYNIRFEDRKQRPVYGHRYWFYLQDAVEDVPEYLVRWDNLIQCAIIFIYSAGMWRSYFAMRRLAAEYNLYPVYKAEFHEVFGEHQDHPEFGPLMLKMKVKDSNGESSMDEDQWEAASAYHMNYSRHVLTVSFLRHLYCFCLRKTITAASLAFV